MKAAVLTQLNAPLTIADVEPEEPGFAQVLVRVLASGICGAQIQEIQGFKGNQSRIPHLLGHEGCGVVESVGPGVSSLSKGDKVVMHWRKGEGNESGFPRYKFDGKTIVSGKVTTFSEYALVSENRVTRVPSNAPKELCALLGCGLSTALGTIESEAQVRFGESVMIIGCGGVGLNLIMAARLAQAAPIVAVDLSNQKRHLAIKSGASLFINTSESIIKNAIRLNKIDSVDVIIDTSGNRTVLEDTIPLLSGTGRYVMVGQPVPGDSVQLTNARHMFDGEGKVIRATQGGRFSPTQDIPRYVRMHEAGRLNIDGIISHRVTLDKINDGIDMVRYGQAGRILVEMI